MCVCPCSCGDHHSRCLILSMRYSRGNGNGTTRYWVGIFGLGFERTGEGEWFPKSGSQVRLWKCNLSMWGLEKVPLEGPRWPDAGCVPARQSCARCPQGSRLPHARCSWASNRRDCRHPAVSPCHLTSEKVQQASSQGLGRPAWPWFPRWRLGCWDHRVPIVPPVLWCSCWWDSPTFDQTPYVTPTVGPPPMKQFQLNFEFLTSQWRNQEDIFCGVFYFCFILFFFFLLNHFCLSSGSNH